MPQKFLIPPHISQVAPLIYHGSLIFYICNQVAPSTWNASLMKYINMIINVRRIEQPRRPSLKELE
ncbi:hypothetical protein Lalb_Chr24g0396601 [Lupinus albus]|uniref:Uncharacterized protein n=1 Tax=Lupinus albus TaxID=3870 RepID=A0A6A4MQ91_LUPAL|nr:hypothetical protein Lalb_Chr24g0396601 [Lupinus albus]